MLRACRPIAWFLPLLLAACGPQEAAPPPKVALEIVPPQVPLACETGRADCDGERANACETDIDSQTTSCGACGQACGERERCVFGHCRRTGVFGAATYHTCALTGDGGAQCWGNGLEGQLGDGTTDEKVAHWGAVRVASLSDAVALSAGGEIVMGATSCAITKSGQLTCWGAGAGTTPHLQAGWEQVVDIAVEPARACGILRDGSVRCADIGDRGELARPTLEKLGGISDAVQISAGYLHQCLVDSTREVVCFGSLDYENRWNVFRHLGDDMVVGRVPGVRGAVQVSAGSGHDCALLHDGRVRCWGNNEYGQIGDGIPSPVGLAATTATVSDMVEVAVGGEHTCALHKNGEVWCWGRGDEGQLGNGKLDNLGAPAPVLGLHDAIHVASGQSFSCAQRAAGGIVCWGERAYLGDGRAQGLHLLPGVTGAKAVRTTDDRVCAMLEKGRVQCVTTASGEVTPRLPVAEPVLEGVESMPLKGGDYDAYCLLRKGGKLECKNDFDDEFAPFSLAGTGPLQMALVGTRYRLTGFALAKTGALSAFFLPERTPARRGPIPVKPVPVPGFTRVQKLAGSSKTACALLASGEIRCVGAKEGTNESVELGAAVHLPVPDALDLVSYQDDLLVLHKAGTVSRFDITNLEKAPQTGKVVAGVTGAVQVTAGDRMGCARLASGEVTCWGNNGCGQLGSGGYAARETAALVTGLGQAVDIDAGDTSVCAVRKDGSVVCWGCDVLEPANVAHPVPVVPDVTSGR